MNSILVQGKPPLLTNDGRVVSMEEIYIDPLYDRPAIKVDLELALEGDREIGLFRDLARANLLQFIARSGLSRAGYHGEIDCAEGSQDIAMDMGATGERVRIPVTWSALRGGDDRFLTHLMRRFRAGLPIELGRILLAAPDTHLSSEKIQEGIDRQWLKLSSGTQVLDDGTVEVPLEEARFVFNDAAFDESHMNMLVQSGKHGLDDLQTLSRWREFPEHMKAKEFQVGAIQISLGPYIAVIEPSLNDSRVFHLAARVLDGIRTTGFVDPVTRQKIYRQVELFNHANVEVPTSELKVRIRLYPHRSKVQGLAGSVINERTLKEGVSFRDIADIEQHPEVLIDLIHKVSPAPWGEKPHALVLGGGRYYENPWADEDSFTVANLRINGQKLVANEDESQILRGEAIPRALRGITEVIGYVGGEQNEGKMVVLCALPSAADIGKLLEAGIGVFVLKDLRMRHDLYPPEKGKQHQNGRNDLYFDDELYKQLRGFESRGAKFYMVFNEVEDAHKEGARLSEHVRELYRGFWVMPKEKERMKKVDTVVAMYGSHVEIKDKILQKKLDGDIEEFMREMEAEFGETVAITHGKGPGFMLTADKAATKHKLFRIGVGIGVEKKGQDPNFNPPAMVDFRDNDRLPRQKLMDDLATFKIFNMGGAGTLEEIAITLCSQKLGKNMLTPIIFVDPLGIGKEGANLWESLVEQIRVLSELPRERLSALNLEAGDLRQGLSNVQLLAAHTPNYCHLVGSYKEAATIIRTFKKDPQAYHKELIDREVDRYGGEGSDDLARARKGLVTHLAQAWDTHEENHDYSGFPVESWLSRAQIASLKREWGVSYDGASRNPTEVNLCRWFEEAERAVA